MLLQHTFCLDKINKDKTLQPPPFLLAISSHAHLPEFPPSIECHLPAIAGRARRAHSDSCFCPRKYLFF